jgi:hypothetical protein
MDAETENHMNQSIIQTPNMLQTLANPAFINEHVNLQTSDSNAQDALLTSEAQLPDCTRMVVLIPSVEMTDDFSLTRFLWQLASPKNVSILFLALAEDYETENMLRRKLTTLAAITRDSRVSTDVVVSSSSTWLDAIRSVLRPGDLVICNLEQTARKGWFSTEPLVLNLKKYLKVPVLPISGYTSTELKSDGQKKSRWLTLTFQGVLIAAFLAGGIYVNAQLSDKVAEMWMMAMTFGLIGGISLSLGL